MSEDSMSEKVQAAFPGAEMAEVTTFEVTLGSELFRIEVLDYGPGAGEHRYVATAMPEGGGGQHGVDVLNTNPAGRLEDALTELAHKYGPRSRRSRST